ncbi:MAG TPA: hypothetical protein VNH18_07235, partial [Bryobacteraceae bacterium]|nr:hypothetical protein [Bryobacteraceae bacterium]
NDLQREHLDQAKELEKRLKAGPVGNDPAGIQTDVQADDYIGNVFRSAVTSGLMERAGRIGGRD